MSELKGDWSKVQSILNPAKLKAKLKQCAAKVGNYGASQVKRGIQSGKNFAPLSSYTISQKGSSKPLINHGDLIGSVTYQVLNDAEQVFIGVKKGKEINIAAVHEFGTTINVTPKMRAYLHFNGLHLRKDTTHIYIPARPFLRPVLRSREFISTTGEIYVRALKEAFSL